jgi:hypothetical protein
MGSQTLKHSSVAGLERVRVKHRVRMKIPSASECLLALLGHENKFGFQQTLHNMKEFHVTQVYNGSMWLEFGKPYGKKGRLIL